MGSLKGDKLDKVRRMLDHASQVKTPQEFEKISRLLTSQEFGELINELDDKRRADLLVLSCRFGQMGAFNAALAGKKYESSFLKSAGARAFKIAMDKSDLKPIKALLQAGFGIDWALDVKGTAPLHYACQLNDKKLVRFLMDNQARVEQEDRKKNRPLHHAILYSCNEILMSLLEAGANPLAQTRQKKTPEDLAQDRARWALDKDNQQRLLTRAKSMQAFAQARELRKEIERPFSCGKTKPPKRSGKAKAL